MPKDQNATTDIQAKVKSLLTKAEQDVINAFFQSEAKDGEIRDYFDGAQEFNDAVTTAGIRIVHQDNHGGEGQGEDYWSVYKFIDKSTKEVCHVKFDGFYQSYDGSEFHEWFFVEPKERMVTFYE